MTASVNDSLFCREQALSTNPLLRLSMLYVDQPMAERLLALHALFASVELACSAVSDENVALRKLAWWGEEVERARRLESRHPIMRELHRSGAGSMLPWDRVQTWLDTVVSFLDAPAPTTTHDLEGICRAIGGPLVELELAVSGVPRVNGNMFSGTVIRRGLAQLIRESLRKPGDSALWWIPMDVLARFGVQRIGLMDGENEVNSAKVFQEILGQNLTVKEAPEDILQNISANKQSLMNLIVLDALVQRKLEYMNKTSPFRNGNPLGKTGFGDLVASWRAARAVSRLI